MTARPRLTRPVALLAAAIVLTGCGADGDSGEGNASACRDAVADAAEATNLPERERRLRPAFEACDDLADFAAQVARYPDALQDVNVEEYVRERCREVEALRDAKLCEAFG